MHSYNIAIYGYDIAIHSYNIYVQYICMICVYMYIYIYIYVYWSLLFVIAAQSSRVVRSPGTNKAMDAIEQSLKTIKKDFPRWLHEVGG